jgi:hypothetical protein
MTEPSTTFLPPTTAERLSRLRLLLTEAQIRASDTSAMGEHLAVIALDGVGELAVGLCVHERTLQRPRELPKAIKSLVDDLGDAWKQDGLQGFIEVHDARNLAQHQGTLPAASQLTRWAAETEVFVRGLIAAVFGVELREVSSALGVRDGELRALLEEAERQIEIGGTGESFAASVQALEQARRGFLGTDANPIRVPAPNVLAESGETRILREAVTEVNARLEVGTFAPDISEWLWMRDVQGRWFNGMSPSHEEARRALVFVMGWVLRYESYSSRFHAQRWEEWVESQRAPTTGMPGPGPRIIGAQADPHPHPRFRDRMHAEAAVAELLGSPGSRP